MAALVRIASDLGAILAAHVALQFVDWPRLGPAHGIKCDRLVSIATEAADFEIAIAGVEGVAERGRGLRRPLVAQHTLVPGFARETIGFLTRFPSALSRGPYGRAVDGVHVTSFPSVKNAPSRPPSASRYSLWIGGEIHRDLLPERHVYPTGYRSA